MRPRVVQTEDQIGFHWVTPAGVPISLQDRVVVMRSLTGSWLHTWRRSMMR
jgi:hypothetical protein